MNFILKLYPLIWCVCVLYNTKLVLAEIGGEKPVIQSNFEHTITTNANYSVFCRGTKPLKWTTPTVSKKFQTWTTFQTQNEQPSDKKYQYGLRLNIFNMTYPFVGFYYCHYENSDIQNKEESSAIYLFVNDPDHLTLLDTGNVIVPVTTTQFQEAILPCKPTSPDVQVTLTTFDDEEVVQLDVLSDHVLYRYNNKYGFITNNTKNVYDTKIFECSFKRNKKIESALVKMGVEIPVSRLAKPYIIDMNDGNTTIGNPLTLQCVTKSDNMVYFHWETPNGPVDYENNGQKINLSIPERSYNKFKQTLTIYNTTAKDSGIYYCNITDNQNHSASNYKVVQIYDH